MRKIFTSLAAAGVLVAGAFVAATLVGSAALAQETEDSSVVTRHGDLLGDALAELVDEDVLSQDQADAVQDRIELKVEERREQFGEFERRRGHRGPGAFGLKHLFVGSDLFDDGVLDADELATLPEDHPVLDPEGPFAEYLDDGELTLDELKSAFENSDFLGRSFSGFGDFDLKLPFFGSDAFEDGVLDADELAELLQDHPLLDPEGPLADLLDDGQLTLEELKGAFESGEFGFPGRGFRGFSEGRGNGLGSFGSDAPPGAASISA